MPPHQLALPWPTDLRSRLASAADWPAAAAVDVPALAQAWLDGASDEVEPDLVDVLVLHDGHEALALTLATALRPLLDASGREGRFARAWSAWAVRRAAEAGAVDPEAVATVAQALRRRLRQRVDPASVQWSMALDLLALEGAPGAAVALDGGWPEAPTWEGLTCRSCEAALEAGVVLEQGRPVGHWLAERDDDAGDPVPLQVTSGPARWVVHPAAWVMARWADAAPVDAERRLAVRCAVLPCPVCGAAEPLVHRMPGGLDPLATVADQA